MTLHNISLTRSRPSFIEDESLPFTNNSSQLLLDIEPSLCSSIGHHYNSKIDCAASKLNTNILHCQQLVQSAKGTRDHQFSKDTCELLDKYTFNI